MPARFLITIVCAAVVAAPRAPLHAQGVTSGVIGGSVATTDGTSADGVRVRVTNTATGFSVESEVRHGRFFIQGLEVGGPYTIAARRIGLTGRDLHGVRVTLGEPVELHIVLETAAVPIDTLRVDAASTTRVNGHGGTGTILPDSLLRRLPTLDRDFFDFVRLVPQISTRVGFRWGFSGGGTGIRFNNFLINGMPERTLVNANAALSGGRSIPLDAVKEYEVLVAPYDVRFGDFAGALVNAVTRAGTNTLHGTAFAYLRNDRLARRGEVALPYDRLQYGLSLGGPLVRDRLHFFVSGELQRLTSPAPGPWVGQPAASEVAVPVSAADLARFADILRGYGLEPGSTGGVENRNPLINTFGRLDLAIPEWRTRTILWVNQDHGTQDVFTRSADVFPLTSYQATQRRRSWLTTLHVHTTLPRGGGGHNELMIGYRSTRFGWSAPVDQPTVRVTVPATTAGLATLSSGTFEQAHGAGVTRFRELNLMDNVTLPIGARHVLTAGVALELFGNTPGGGVPESYGTWTFPSLDALASGTPSRYLIRRDSATASVPLSGTQLAVYVGDHWRIRPRLALTLGLRADLLGVGPRAPYNPQVDSLFSRRTDALPARAVHISPRAGFVWDVDGTGRDRVRGGVGIFTGRPPPWWLYTALTSHGTGGVLRCGSGAADRGLPPAFEPDQRRAPTSCVSGPGLDDAANGDVDLLARDLRMAQSLRASFAYDRRLPWNALVTGEVVVTRNVSDLEFVNLDLAGPQGVDSHGRVLYGTIAPSGIAAPAKRSDFSEVIELRNNSRNRAVQASVRIEKPFADGFYLTASYTYSRVRDVQTPLRTAVPGTVNWSARAVSGRHDDDRPGISLNDVPHRIVLAGMVRAPWRRWPTELAFYWVGESGSPFTYVATGIDRRGDLNADGSNMNDPIYVPRSVHDTSEIRFTGVVPGADNSPAAQADRILAQRTALEALIGRTPCLRLQRGRHVARNSCREPWSHTTVALLRQHLPFGRHAVEGELQVFNLLDLLGSPAGRVRVARPGLLRHVAQATGPDGGMQPIFHLDATRPDWVTLDVESRFQLQLALRYRF